MQMAPSEEEFKEPCDEGKEKRGKVGLNLNIQKTKIMAFGSVTSWQIDGEKMETVAEFIFLGSKITAESGCRHKIKDTCSLEEKL